MAKQFKFDGNSFRSQDCFGGSLLKGNAREPRPLNTKMPLHLVLRADVAGCGTSMRNPKAFGLVNQTVTHTAKTYGVKIYEYANVGNHLHLLLKIGNRRLWARFIRELTGRIAQQVKHLNPRTKGKRFWLFKPYTRVVKGWGRAYKAIKEYVIFNQWEGDGIISRRDWKSLRQMRETFAATAYGITTADPPP